MMKSKVNTEETLARMKMDKNKCEQVKKIITVNKLE